MSEYKLPTPQFTFDGANNTALANVGLSLKASTPDVNLSDAGGAFSFDNLGIDLKGFGTLASLVGGFMAHNDDKKYKNKLMKREDERIARDRARQDKFDKGMQEAWK